MERKVMKIPKQEYSAEFKGAYGSPLMVREMHCLGFPSSKQRVERLMQENGIRAKLKACGMTFHEPQEYLLG
jgi:hypothetical protein